ncbi:50S ribosomal protein L10 [Vaccinium witches'-broom phytoplasma]|uniref:50S ribosomal protein L10 n=1 Tax=Vaccinium witches'-broom phytoplasma TaxID=85642 RepID=UPI00035CA2F8|nr:50S ribosomal protein L10 [Vaccinium witches'-broom phytoplasma]
MLRPVIEHKIENVNTLTEKINKSKLVVLFEYKGLKVSDFTQLRVQLREFGSNIKLYSNNIIKRTFTSVDHQDLTDFKNSKALLFSEDDLISPLKVLYDFSKTNKFVKISSGLVENKIYSVEMMHELATLPSREALLTMLASGMLMPLKELSVGLDILSKKE